MGLDAGDVAHMRMESELQNMQQDDEAAITSPPRRFQAVLEQLFKSKPGAENLRLRTAGGIAPIEATGSMPTAGATMPLEAGVSATMEAFGRTALAQAQAPLEGLGGPAWMGPLDGYTDRGNSAYYLHGDAHASQYGPSAMAQAAANAPRFPRFQVCHQEGALHSPVYIGCRPHQQPGIPASQKCMDTSDWSGLQSIGCHIKVNGYWLEPRVQLQIVIKFVLCAE